VTVSAADRAANPLAHDATAPHTVDGGAITLTPTNIHAQIAAGAAVNETSGFTMPAHGTTVQIILGAGGVATTYVVTGTWQGSTVTESIVASAAGTFEGTQQFDTITSLTTAADPQGTTDLQTLDAVWPRGAPARGIWVGGAGILSVRLRDDTADVAYSGIAAGTWMPIEVKMVRSDKTSRSGITATTATLLTAAR
jgi:hypothetical protein